jgi:hypothetical protein
MSAKTCCSSQTDGESSVQRACVKCRVVLKTVVSVFLKFFAKFRAPQKASLLWRLFQDFLQAAGTFEQFIVFCGQFSHCVRQVEGNGSE